MLAALQPEAQVESLKTQVEMSMLKKTMDTQQEMAAQLLQMVGKGSQLDIRA